MRVFFSLCLFTSVFSAAADIGRFIEPIQIAPKAPVPTVRYVVKSSAFVSPHASNPQTQEAAPVADSIVIDRQLMEKHLGEALAHRFQASGRVSAFLTREWVNCRSMTMESATGAASCVCGLDAWGETKAEDFTT
jgi:hypothetical protein